MRNIHTDLACELSQGIRMPGIISEQYEKDGAQITKITIDTPKAALRIGKPIGRYYTLMHHGLCKKQADSENRISLLIGDLIRQLLPQTVNPHTTLVLGLGNSAITPDALGSKTTEKVLVTRHVIENIPEAVDARVKSVCAIAPGVLGVTGLETGEVAQGIVDHVRPGCVICIDSLAAQSVSRLLTTVQIADTGICPGSGLHNPRRELTEKTLGIPVISIGIPLVVGIQSILSDAKADSEFTDNSWDKMVVTPTQIDEAVNQAAKIIAKGINFALQPDLSPQELESLAF